MTSLLCPHFDSFLELGMHVNNYMHSYLSGSNDCR